MNRFLLRESYDQFDLFNEVKQYIELIGGTLSIDDTVIEKLYSNPNLSEFIGYFWSGNKHKTIKGINLITLNRQVSIKKGEYQSVESLDIEGLGQSFT